MRSITALSIVLLPFIVPAPPALGQAPARAILQPATLRKLAPYLHAPDSMGRVANLRSYRGRVVLLDFWATWCHGCKEEIPWFAEFQRKYHGGGLEVIGVSLDEDGWKVVKPFIQSEKVPYTIVLGDQSTAKEYGIGNMPDAFLLDRRGRVAAKYIGLVDRDDLEMNLKSLLKEK